MKPLPETREVLEQLAGQGGELAATLTLMGEVTQEVVPECVGLSLAMIEDGLTFTLVATNDELAVLDAIQYLDGGPCVEAVDRGERIGVEQSDLFNEDRWLMYAQASSCAGVASSLSLPILSGERVVGGVNLYGATADAFRGRHEELAKALDASAEGAVTNADLEFSTRLEAAQAPSRLQDLRVAEDALGIIAANQDIDRDTASELLKQAAARAGITEIQAAHAIRRLRDL